MVDIASLAIQIDTSDVARAEGDLERLGSKGAKAEQAAKGVGDAYQQASGKVGAVAGAASKAGTALERNSVAARENARELASVDRTAMSLSGSMSKLGATLAGLTAGMSIKGIIDISDNYGQMADRIKMATESTEEYRMVQERLLQSANKTYRPLAEAQELYIRTADAIRSLGYQTKDALDITDSFSYLLVTNAASADKASNAIDAYSKSIQSGRIEVDSWQSLIAAMPSVVDTMSRSLGKSAEEIRQLGITGKLSLSDLNEGLRQTVDANQKLADGMGTTLNDALIRASNNMSTYLGESSKVTASSRLLSGALDGVTENIDLIAGVLGGAAVAAITRYSVVTAQSTAASIAHAVAVRQQAAEELRLAQAQVAATASAVAQARANVGLAAGTGQVTAALAAQEAAQKRLAVAQAATASVGRSMLGLMGGPLGLIATVGLTALAFVDFGDKAEGGMGKAADATEQAAMRIRNATRNLLPNDIGTLNFDALQAEVVQVETELKSARDELERFQRNFDAGNISEQWLDKPRDKVAALEGALVKLKAEMDGVRFASDTAGQSYSKNLERQAVLVGKVTEEQRLLAMVHAGYIKLSEQDLAISLERARRIDAVTASLKGSTGSVKEQENAYRALYDRLYPAEAAQRKYTDEVERLKAVLRGNALADAIARLNDEMLRTGADATGPGDVIEDYRKELQRLEDQLDPVGKATDQYRKDVERLEDALARGEIGAERHAQLLGELEKQYKQNTNATSEWAQWTESSLERVDSAFADAWRNIGDGFSSFRDSLTDAFKQMLAELAHMAITRPIVMQIGAALGIGGGSAGAGLVSLGGGAGSSGGSLLADAWNYGSSLYGAATSGFGQAVMAGWNSGGLTGAIGGGSGYVGNLASGAWNTASGWLGAANGATTAGYTGAQFANWAAGGSQALGASQAGYTGAQYANWVNTQNTVANVGTYAPWLAGVSGAFMGYANSGWKGAATGAAGGFLGAKGGAALGTAILPGIGTIIGAALGGLLGSTVGSKIFGGDWVTKDGGIALSAVDGDLLGQSYTYQKKKGGLFSSNKKRTRYGALDDETLAALQQTYDATESGVAQLFESLSLSVEEGALDGLQIARKQISTKGKTEEEIQKAISEWFGEAAEAMNAELNKVFSTGLDYDLAGMQAFVNNLLGVNEVLRYLDVGMYDASVAGGKLAESLSAAAGGLDALAANSQTYYGAFFTEAEKIEDTIDSVKRAFESADVELAGSREAYRAMVEDIDLTTQVGQEMFATLMALSGQAAQYYSILEQQAAQAYAALQANVAVYYEQFTTAGEKADDMLASVTASFEALELALPSTRDGFRAVVDGLDTSTEAGQRMFETLMSVAGAADAYYDILEARAAEAQAAAIAAEQALSEGYLAAVSVAQSAFGKMQESVAAERRALDDEYTAKLDVINAARDAVGSAIGRLRTAVEAEQDRLRTEQEAALDRVSELADLSDSLRSGLRAMRLESEQFDRMRRDQAKAQVSSALALARSGGSLQGLDLSDALSELSNSDTSGFASFEEYARDYWRTANDINELAGLTDAQLSVDEQIAKSLEEQSASLGEMLASAQSQYDALLGIDNAVLAVGDAVALFESSLVTAQQTASDTQIQQLALQHAESTAYFDQMLSDAQRQMDILQGIDSSVLSVGRALANFQKAASVATSTPKTNSQTVASAYVEVLGRTADADGLKFWTDKLAAGELTQAQLKQQLARGALDFDSGSYTGAVSLADIEASKKAAAKYLGIPGFAAGGLHSGGLRLVGENGPELEVTGPSRIYNASQTAAMLGGGGDTAQAIASLQQSVERQGDALRSIAKHTMKTAKYTEYLERFDVDGLPKERGAA